MFLRRWSPSTQLLAVIVVIGIAPVLLTELDAHGLERIKNTLKDWQTLVTGVLAITAARMTITEMRASRKQEEEFRTKERFRLRELEITGARNRLFDIADGMLNAMLSYLGDLNESEDPRAFAEIDFDDLAMEIKNLVASLARADARTAAKILGVSLLEPAESSNKTGAALNQLVATYRLKLEQASERSHNQNICINFDAATWEEWPSKVSQFKVQLDDFRVKLLVFITEINAESR